jgi:hypothetical protein
MDPSNYYPSWSMSPVMLQDGHHTPESSLDDWAKTQRPVSTDTPTVEELLGLQGKISLFGNRAEWFPG